MSKKIVIPSTNIRYKLVSLFHSFMDSYYESCKKRSSHCRNMYDWMDDDDELAYWRSQGFIFSTEEVMDDDSCVIWPPTKSKKGKKGKDSYDLFWEGQERHKKKHKRGGKRARVIDITEPYSGFEDVSDDDFGYTEYDEVDDNGVTNGKEIYYYPDYHDKDNRLEFNTLSDFCNFCEDNGYIVSDSVANDIMFRRVSHTCLRPDSREYGMYEIMAEESYGVMFYEVCEDAELGG
jgi:hypothetical protein